MSERLTKALRPDYDEVKAIFKEELDSKDAEIEALKKDFASSEDEVKSAITEMNSKLQKMRTK